MSRSSHPKARGVLVALVMALMMLAPAWAWAGTPYSIHWAFTQENPMCETAELGAHNGDAFFSANGTPLPTFEIPGAFVVNADGTESNTAEAAFNSVLLRTGGNDFGFVAYNTGGQDWCVHQHNVASLVSAPLGLHKPLFDVRRDGTVFAGSTNLSLSLAEINPPLARDIANLETEIEAERAWLLEHASETAHLAARLDLLQQLDTELKDLVTRPLDEIAQTDLDAILNRYAEVVDEATKAALDQLVLDLQQSVLDLENELASLIDTFGAQADAVADLATQSARDAGFLPDDPSSYALGAASVPWVEIPDLSNVPGAFDPGNDPYAAYADNVIAALEEDVSNGQVTARADFVATVRAWRTNSAAIEQALLMRTGVSQAETSAFLNAQNRVSSYVQQFMDASDWFKDSKIPPELRAYVDGILLQAFGPSALEMKDNLLLYPTDTIDLSQLQLFQTIEAFGGAMSAVSDSAQAYADVMGTLVHAMTRIGIGFVPYVGPALDLCEAVTGKEWCLPSGKELSTEERIFSGAGFAISNVAKVWGGVKNAGISPAATLIAEDVAKVDEAMAKGLRANPRTWYKTLRGAATSKDLEPFEKVAGKYLQDDGRALIGIGDDGVRQVLKIPKDAPGDLAKAPDFLSVTKGNTLALSEVKGIEADTGKVAVDKALVQLENAMKKLTEKGLAGDVERVELIMPKGASLNVNDYKVMNGYLVKWSTGERITLKGFKNFIMVIEL